MGGMCGREVTMDFSHGVDAPPNAPGSVDSLLSTCIGSLTPRSGHGFSQGCTIEETAERAITLCQLRNVCAAVQRRCEAEGWTNKAGGRLTPLTVLLYDLVRLFIKPETLARRCSYVELVATGPQRPKWFVSHWWGEPVLLFLLCLERHAADYMLEVDAGYWVCAYANNQHSLGGAITADPAESSFFKALELAEGRVLSVLDEEGVTYKRVWCCLEIFLSIGRTYAMYTAKEGCEAYAVQAFVEGGGVLHSAMYSASSGEGNTIPIERREAVGITPGVCPADHGWPRIKERRERAFPVALARRALNIRLQDAETTLPEDRRRILNYIVGRRGADLELEPKANDQKYSETNAALQGRFAEVMWRLLLEARTEMQTCATKLASSGLRHLSFSFRDCRFLTDDAFRLLLRSLPPTEPLVDLRVDVGQSGISDESIVALSDVVCNRGLRAFFMDGCCKEDGLRVLENASAWPATIEYFSSEGGHLTGSLPAAIGCYARLRLLYVAANALTGPIPAEIGGCVSLQWLYLQHNRLTGAIPAALGNCEELLCVNLSDNNLHGAIPGSLGRCAKLFQLDLSGNANLAGAIPQELFDGCAHLESLRLGGCPGLSAEQIPERLRLASYNGMSAAFEAARRSRDAWRA